MGNAVQEVAIRISTPADLSGAKAAQEALASLTQAAGKTAEQEQGAAQAAGALGQATAKAAAETGRFADSAGRLREANGRFVEMGKSATEAATHIGEATQEADKLLEALKFGVGIDLGGKIVESVAELPKILREAIAEGVKFNTQMETLGISLASAFRAAEPEKYLNFAAAKEAGSEALDLLKQKANALGLDFHALGETLSINLASLAHAGITDVQKQIDTITLLQQVTQAKGISGFQATRDIIDLLNGNANRTILGKELAPLGVTDETIKKAKEAGQLYEFLASKFGAYTEAAAASADTFAAAQQRLKNETEQLYGEITKPVFEALKEAYQSLAAEIQKPEVVEQLKQLGFEVSEVVRLGAGLAAWAVEHAGALLRLAEVVGTLSVAFAAAKLAQLTVTLGLRAAAWVAETLAIRAHTVAVIADGEAQAAANVAGAARVAGGGITAGGVAGVVGVGVAVGASIYLARKASAEAATQVDIDDSKASAREAEQLAQLSEQIRQAHTFEEQQAAIAAVTERVKAIQERISELKGRDTPEAREQLALAEQQLNTVEGLRTRFSEIVGTSTKRLSTEEKITKELQNQAEAAKEQAKVIADNAKAATGIEDAESKRRFDALNPQQQLGQLTNRRDELLRGPLFPFTHNDGSDTPDSLAERVQDSSAFTPKEKQGQLAAAKELGDTLAKIVGLQQEIAKGDEKAEDDEAREADAEAHKSIAQSELAAKAQAELAISQARIAGNETLARQLEFQLKLQEETARLDKEGANDATIAATQARLRGEFAAKENGLNKERADALRSSQEELAILHAKATGQEDLAARLQKEKELRAEITKLQEKGLSYSEAQAQAEEKQRLEQQVKDRQFQQDKNPYQRRDGETGGEYFQRTGRIDATPHDTDPNGGLHTSGLETSGLQTGGLGPGGAAAASNAGQFLSGQPGVGDALANAPSAAGLLANAPTASDALLGSAGLGFGGVPTAAKSFDVGLPDLTPAKSPGDFAGVSTSKGSGGDLSGNDKFSALTDAAQDIQQAGEDGANAAEETSSGMQDAVAALQGAAQTMQNFASQLQTLQQQVNALAAQGKQLMAGG